MTKRKETAYETRLRERFQARVDRLEEMQDELLDEDGGIVWQGRNREERRYRGENAHARAIPRFRTTEQADRWLDKQAKKYKYPTGESNPEPSGLEPDASASWASGAGGWTVKLPDGTNVVLNPGETFTISHGVTMTFDA